MDVFPGSFVRIRHNDQKRIYNPVKHLRWSAIQKSVNFFRKTLHPRCLTEYASNHDGIKGAQDKFFFDKIYHSRTLIIT